MDYLNTLSKFLFRIILKLKAHNMIFHLCRETDEVSNLIGNALKEILQNDIETEEKVWIDRIESLRKELNSSTTKISIVDYGAGKPNIGLTDEEMNKGRILFRTIGEVCRSDSRPYFESLLLFKLIRKFRPSNCLELGTSLGISASFQAAALKLNGMGKIITLEGSKSLAHFSEAHFQLLGLDNVTVIIGRFKDTMDKVLNGYESVDFVFIDGHHDEKATLTYFEQIMPFFSGRGLLVLDDISWSKGMQRAWNTIKSDKRVKISVDLWQIGVCIIDS